MTDLSDAQKLTAYGFGQVSPSFWSRAAGLQYFRLEATQSALANLVDQIRSCGWPEDDPDGMRTRNHEIPQLESMGVLDAYFLVLAAHKVLLFAKHYETLSADGRVTKLLKAFELQVPVKVKLLRDVLEHFDVYRINMGKMQPQYVSHDVGGWVISWGEGDDLRGEISFTAGGMVLELRPFVHALNELADKLYVLWFSLMDAPSLKNTAQAPTQEESGA